MRKAISRILALTLICAITCAIPAVAYAAKHDFGFIGWVEVVNCKSWVSLREKPRTHSAQIMKVPKGAIVEAHYYNSEFAECYYGDEHGYILTTYLSNPNGKGTAAGFSSEYLGKKKVYKCNEFVTLRRAPSTSATAVTRVAKGEIVDCYYYDDEFTLCYYNGLEGYILNKYLTAAKK